MGRHEHGRANTLELSIADGSQKRTESITSLKLVSDTLCSASSERREVIRREITRPGRSAPRAQLIQLQVGTALRCRGTRTFRSRWPDAMSQLNGMTSPIIEPASARKMCGADTDEGS